MNRADLTIRRATTPDLPVVCEILTEAAAWLRERGMPLWRDDELLPEVVAPGVGDGEYVLAEYETEAAGTLRVQLVDPDIWPDVRQGESAFVHRLAVRRRFAGGVVSNALLAWAAAHARQIGRPYLRLDCDADRPRLRAVYENAGFRHHSDFQAGPYFVARYELETNAPVPRG